MKIALNLFLASILITSCNSKVQQAETPYASEFSEFIAIKGHDPVEEGVLTSPYLKHRLIKLMGEGKYDTLVKIMYECTPIGFNQDVIYWMGYAKDDPQASGGAILIDLNEDIIYVGYEVDDQIERFSEANNLTEQPTRLQLWLNRRDKTIPQRIIEDPDTTEIQ